MKTRDIFWRVSWGIILTIVLGLIWVAGFVPLLGAQSASSWLAANPTLAQREDLPAGQQLPETVISAGNIPCETTAFTVRPKIVPLQQEIIESGCAVRTVYGLTASGGYTRMLGVDAKLYNNGGGAVTMYSIPGQKGSVTLENTANGQKLQYYQNGAYASRREFNTQTSEWKFYLANSGNWTLKDKSGKVLYVRPESIAFSNNGKWMVADSEYTAMLLVNLETSEVTPFSAPYKYNIGLSVAPHMAVSDDGKTVVMTSDRGDFKVTDTTSCSTVPVAISGPVVCTTVSHEAFLRSKIPGYYRIYQPRFINDRLVSLYTSYKPTPTTSALARFRLAPMGEAVENQDYLALGDSFASGEGAYDYFPETDTDANMCHLSRQSYPYQIGRQLNLSSYNSAACSGAKIQDITTFVQKQKIPSPNNMGRLLPGYKKQIQYVRDQNPNVVTVGIGGNDIGFGDIVKRCIGVLKVPSTCFESYEDRLELVRSANKQFDRLADAFTQTKKTTKKDSKIYAVGYPRVARENGLCASNVLLNNDEVIFTNQIIDYFNQIIELAANKTGVRYVDVSEAFAGHKMCENQAGLVAFNGVTLGNDKLGIIGNESYHPNLLGHQLYRQRILNQTSNFTQIMPLPNAALKPPSEDSSLPILSAPKSNRALNQITYEDKIVSNTVVKEETTTVQAGSEDHFLQPNSSYRIELHSTPLQLGTFTTDDTGDITASITLPDSVAAGFHTLHIYGQNIVGASVDIYKTVYVADINDTQFDRNDESVTQTTTQPSKPEVVDSDLGSNADKQGAIVADEQTGKVLGDSDFAKMPNRLVGVLMVVGILSAFGLSVVLFMHKG